MVHLILKQGETTVSEDPVTDEDDIYWDKIGEQDNYTVQAILLPQKVQGKSNYPS